MAPPSKGSKEEAAQLARWAKEASKMWTVATKPTPEMKTPEMKIVKRPATKTIYITSEEAFGLFWDHDESIAEVTEERIFAGLPPDATIKDYRYDSEKDLYIIEMEYLEEVAVDETGKEYRFAVASPAGVLTGIASSSTYYALGSSSP